MNCPQCKNKLKCQNTKTQEIPDKPELYQRIRYYICEHCDYTKINGSVQEIWYLSKKDNWICELLY